MYEKNLLNEIETVINTILLVALAPEAVNILHANVLYHTQEIKLIQNNLK